MNSMGKLGVIFILVAFVQSGGAVNNPRPPFPALTKSADSAELTERVFQLLRQESNFERIFSLAEILEAKGSRHASAQSVLLPLLKRKDLPAPTHNRLVNALVLTSLDPFFLSLVLLDPKTIFLSSSDQQRIMNDPARWVEVPDLLYHCVVDHAPPPLLVIQNGDEAKLDDLERRHTCLYALGTFKTRAGLELIARVLSGYPAELGTDSTRVIRGMLLHALQQNETSLINRANEILLNVVREKENDVILRINAISSVSLPRNLSIEAELEQLLWSETQADLIRFLKLALHMVHQSGFDR